MQDPFDYPLEPMTPQRAETLQKEQRARNSWAITGTAILLIALALFYLIINWMGNESQKTLGGDQGILQDGVYYIYGGGGVPLPNQVKTPIGLCAYTPGQEPEVLVSAKDYSLDMVFPCWDINSHGLYFSDRTTASLYRMDLDTREVTELYSLPDVPSETSPYIFLNGLWEDRIALVCYDGFHDYHVVLDCRTGEVLSKEKDDQGQDWNLVAGERTLVQYQMDAYTDLRENNISVLPGGEPSLRRHRQLDLPPLPAGWQHPGPAQGHRGCLLSLSGGLRSVVLLHGEPKRPNPQCDPLDHRTPGYGPGDRRKLSGLHRV